MDLTENEKLLLELIIEKLDKNETEFNGFYLPDVYLGLVKNLEDNAA